MIGKALIILSVSALYVLGDGATSEQFIKKNIKHHDHHDEHHGHDDKHEWAYPSFEFSYKVNDPHTKDIKGQHVVREGDKADGVYWLLQPDGYKRTVNYHADKHTGFNADVKYSVHHHGHKDHHSGHHDHHNRHNDDHDHHKGLGHYA